MLGRPHHAYSEVRIYPALGRAGRQAEQPDGRLGLNRARECRIIGKGKANLTPQLLRDMMVSKIGC